MIQYWAMSNDHRLGGPDAGYEHLFLDAWGIDEPVNAPAPQTPPAAAPISGDRTLGGQDAGYEHLFEDAWTAEDAQAAPEDPTTEATRASERLASIEQANRARCGW